jgi:DNA-directed RNA polymerase subunit RPC12/RpoP
MSSLVAVCPFCGYKAKRFVLPNGIMTDYFVCTRCFRTFTLIDSKIGEMARIKFNARSDIVTASSSLMNERETKYRERL